MTETDADVADHSDLWPYCNIAVEHPLGEQF